LFDLAHFRSHRRLGHESKQLSDFAFDTALHPFFDDQVTAADLSEELRNNPVLAAALALPNGTETDTLAREVGPGACVLREIYRRRRLRREYEARHSGSSSDEAKQDIAGGEVTHVEATRSRAASGGHEEERGKRRQQRQTERAAISWPEFVGAFLPLGQWVPAEDSTDHKEQRRRGEAARQGEGGTGRGKRGDGGLVDRDEMQLLRVAFAVVAAGASLGDGGEVDARAMVSLAELRAASALLDGEEPPEGPIRKALEVSAKRDRASCCRVLS